MHLYTYFNFLGIMYNEQIIYRQCQVLYYFRFAMTCKDFGVCIYIRNKIENIINNWLKNTIQTNCS